MEAVIVVEVLGGHDRVRARHRVVAAGGDGHVVVSDLDSVNGIEVGGRRLHGAARVLLPDDESD